MLQEVWKTAGASQILNLKHLNILSLAKAWNENVPEEIIYTIITFDDNARIAPTKKLDSDIEQHGGRSTDIPKGF